MPRRTTSLKISEELLDSLKPLTREIRRLRLKKLTLKNLREWHSHQKYFRADTLNIRDIIAYNYKLASRQIFEEALIILTELLYPSPFPGDFQTFLKTVKEKMVGPKPKISSDKQHKNNDSGINISDSSFDEEAYQKAKPHFEKAWQHAKEAGFTLKELAQYIVNQFGANVRPYFKRFLLDKKKELISPSGAVNMD